MDLNKYIALYLVKNKYCSLPGLGTLQLNKEAAAKKGASIEPPVYNITFKNVGSIDDQLPHFIGLKENISTNNASNALSVFAKEVKEEIAEGRPFVIDGLGRFISNNGKLDFQQQSDLDLGEFIQQLPAPPTPTVIATQNSTLNSANDTLKVNQQNNPKQSVSIGKILLPIGLIAALAVGGYYAYNYMNSKPVEAITDAASTTASVTDTATNTAPVDTNTVAIAANDTNATSTAPNAVADTNKPAPVAAPVANGPAMKVVIQTYKTEAEANKRVASLVKLSKAASMLKADSATYHVVISLPSTSNTPEKVVDSLRRFYNPGGKVFEVK
jgi:hypothetical protein